MMRLGFLLLLLPVLFSLGLTAVAGEGGEVPPSKTYTFWRTNPEPAGDVGTGKFFLTAGVGSATITSDDGKKEDWTRGADGQYRKVVDPGLVSLCIFLQNAELIYIYKWDDDHLSNGHLQD